MKGKNFKFLLPLIGVVVLLFIVMMYYKSSNKSAGSPAVVQNNQESKESTNESTKEKKEKDQKTDSEITLSTLEDFQEAFKKEDDPNHLYGGKDLSMDKLQGMDRPIMINFTWIDCQPCKIFDPILQEAFQKYHQKVYIKDVEVTVNEKFTREVGIRVTPSQFFMAKDLKLPEEFVGRNDFYETTYAGKSVVIHEGLLSKEDLDKLMGMLSNE